MEVAGRYVFRQVSEMLAGGGDGREKESRSISIYISLSLSFELGRGIRTGELTFRLCLTR